MLIAEDGTGKPDAESYISLEEANDYWEKRGNPAAWSSADQPTREAALRIATDYLEGEMLWKGEVAKPNDQALSWPRSGVEDKNGVYIDSDEIPRTLKQATAELAKNHLENDITQILGRATKKEKLDKLEVEYLDKAVSTPQWKHALRLLNGLTIGRAGGANFRFDRI